jgi:hypothetical protein
MVEMPFWGRILREKVKKDVTVKKTFTESGNFKRRFD